MLRVQRAEWQPGRFLPSAHQPRALSLSLHLGKNTAPRVFPLCPTITHTTNQACGFLPEEQELVKELLNAKSESNRNKKEVGEEQGGRMGVISESLCPGKDEPRTTSSAPNPSVHSWGSCGDRDTAQQLHTLRCFVCVCLWETAVCWRVTPRSGTDLDCLCLVPYSLCL